MKNNSDERTSSQIQMSESFKVCALLAISGGLLDAYTFLCRGGVFANAQTGNIVLIGIYAAKGSLEGAVSALIPVIAYAIGILVTMIIRGKFKTEETHMLHWRHGILFLEIVLLALITLIPQGQMDNMVNTIISFVCAMQVQTFRKIHGNAFASTMCTGNLRGGTEALWMYVLTQDKKELNRCLCLYGVICFFILGAVIGSIISLKYPQYAIHVSIVIYIIAFVVMTQCDKAMYKTRD